VATPMRGRASTLEVLAAVRAGLPSQASARDDPLTRPRRS